MTNVEGRDMAALVIRAGDHQLTGATVGAMTPASYNYNELQL